MKSEFAAAEMPATAIAGPRPWHREPWPWILMAGPALVIVAGIATAVIAFRDADALVADDHYRRGLGINRELAREERARELGISGRLEIADATATAWLEGRAALPDRLKLSFAHATRAGEDRVVFLARTAQGGYSAPLPELAAGRWRVIVEAESWRITGLADTRVPAAVRLDAGT